MKKSIAATVSILALVPSLTHAKTDGNTLQKYVDPSHFTSLQFGTQSHWLQPWRSYLETIPASKHPKTVKGGSYLSESRELRCANRLASDASWNKRDPQIPKSKWWLTDGMFVGFRLVRPVKQPSQDEIEKFFALYLK